MEAITLESLGITEKEIIGRVVDKIVDRLLEDQIRFSGDGEEEGWRETGFAKELDKRVKGHIDSTVSALFDAHVMGRIEELVNGLTLQATNEWGEAKGETITFVQYLIQRAETYMTEQVNYDGKSRSKDHYGAWTAHGTRISSLVEKYLNFHIEKAMKTIVAKGNETLVSGIEETVKIKLAEIAEKLTVEVGSKR